MQDDTISTVEAGLILGFTRRWILELIRRGELEAVRIGRDWRVGRVSVLTYKRKRNEKTTSHH